MVGNFFPFKIEMSSSHCSLLLLVICFCTQLFAGQLTIVLPEKPSAFETNAAKELSSFIEAASGTAPAILHEPGKSPERAIFVGSTRFAEASAAQVPDGDEAWLNQEIDGNLVLLGNGRRGTLYAVYEFLEHNLGIVFLDDWNTYIPKTAEITWKAGMLRSGVPSFAVRGFNSYIIQDERGQSRFSARMRQNFFSYYIPADYPAAYRGCIDVVGSPDFAHTYYHYTKTLSTSQQNILSWSERHQRRIVSTSSAGPGQICYSNPETAEWFARRLREFIAKDRKTRTVDSFPKYYALEKNDNHNECECANCKKLLEKYRTQAGVQLFFTNSVARKIAKEYPEIRILFDAYGKDCRIPEGIRPEPNVMVQVAFGYGRSERPRDCYRSWNAPYNKNTCQLMEDWFAIAKHKAIWDYWVDYFNKDNLPSENLLATAENLKIYKRMGVEFLFIECESADCASFHPLRLWLGMRLAYNVELDPMEESLKFINAYFGAAAPPIIQYLALLQNRMQSLTVPVQDLSALSRNDLDDDFFITSEALFAEAEKAAAGDKAILERIANERVPVDRARLERRKKLSPDLQPKIPVVLKRYRENHLRRIARYSHPNFSGNKLKSVNDFCNAIEVSIPELEGFNLDSVLIDLAWPQLSHGRYENPVVEDHEAYGGKAIRPGVDKLENKGIVLGIYDLNSGQYCARHCMIPPSALPQDEKFHWYTLGRLTLPRTPLLYMDWTWVLQTQLDGAYGNPDVYANNVSVYVSLKVQGPLYVKGSSKPNLYCVDRVVVCRADMDTMHPSTWPIPAKLQGRKIIAELSGTSLRFPDKLADVASLVACALPVSNATVLLKGVSGNNTRISSNHVENGKNTYALYMLGPVKLSRNSSLEIGNRIIPLGDYWNENTKDMHYEVWLSLKSTSDNAYCDRVFLVQSNIASE